MEFHNTPFLDFPFVNANLSNSMKFSQVIKMMGETKTSNGMVGCLDDFAMLVFAAASINFVIVSLIPHDVIADPQIDSETVETAPVEVISASPLLGSGIDADKVPNSTRVIRSKDLTTNGGPPSLSNALKDQMGSVNLNTTLGNPYQPDLTFRGFTASPVVGVPQGFAVYQNGVRVNEAFGDTVNWDLIPDFAIDSMNLTSTNPVFGFNALGGAAAIEMKTGFTFRGAQAEVSGGSFGRVTGIAQYGKNWDNWAFYFGASPSYETGWRENMPSRIDRTYTDAGYDNGHSSFHLGFTYADNSLGGTGPTPEALLAQDWRAGVDYPGSIANKVAMVSLRGNTELSKTQSLQGNLYYRNFHQDLTNGAPASVQPCMGNPSNFCSSSDNGTTYTVPLLDQNGNSVPVSAANSPAFPGIVALATTQTGSFGAALQTTSTAQLASHDNQWVLGGSIDQGNTTFNSSSQFGSFDSTRTVIPTNLFVTSAGSLSNVSLGSSNTYTGLYLTDTFDVTSALSLTASGRYNLGLIQLTDQLGGPLTGFHRYDRFNPAIGATYKITPSITAFADYAESNRIPTAAELSCADPTQSCSLASFFIADPDLQQVVAKTYETGLRGGFVTANKARIQWNANIFRTDNTNDIIEIASLTVGRGYFQNGGNTRRQGVETGISYQTDRWRAYTDYSYVDATFQSSLTLNSPFNPFADSNGHIQIVPGNALPSIPNQRLKVGADYWLTQKWSLGVNWTLVSSQFLQGDESNQNAPVPGYGVVGFHSQYMIKKWLQVFAWVDNVFDRHFSTFGTFINDSGVPPGNIGLTRTVSPAPPLGAFLGLRAQMDSL